jgi:hypothetical protein
MHFHDCFIQVILKGMYFFSFFICPCNISYYPLL